MKNEAVPASEATPLDPLTSLAIGVGATLAETRAAIESSFSATGDSLVECTMNLNAVSAAHEGLPGALDGEEFAQAEASLVTISEELARISGSDRGDESEMGELEKLATDMADPLAELRKVMLLLEIISANAGILAAEVSGENTELGAFTGNMIALAHGAIDGLATFAKSRSVVLSQLSGATAAGKRFAETHADTLEHVRTRLTEHADAIARYRASAGQQLAHNGDATRRIATRVADVVAAMQIGDITRQRIEHVERGLEMLVELSQPDSAVDPALRPATRSQLRRLVEAQLRDTIAEYRDRTQFISQSLPQLADDTDRVLADGDAQARTLTMSSGDTLAGMLADLRQVRSIFADFRSVHGEADQTAQAVATAIEEMVRQLTTIDRIERQIRMLSFNMAARCNRLGEDGRAMTVITQQLRELAMRTESAAGQVQGYLGDGAKRAATIASGDDRSAELARLDDATNETIARIEHVTEVMNGHAQTLAERGPGALAILRHAALAARSLDDVTEVWDAALMEIEAKQDLVDAEGEPDAATFAELRRSYTMDSERRVHDEICGAAGFDEEVGTSYATEDIDDDPLAALF
tara:strand:- start:3270 stop:5024 length:1755 start_codon:yes stop_codon:yes gene_type:complete